MSPSAVRDGPASARQLSVRMPDSLNNLKAYCETRATSDQYPLASSISSNVPQYDIALQPSEPKAIAALQDEWFDILHSGPGVFVLQNFTPYKPLIDRVNDVFSTIVERERQSAKGDHFASSGKNSRIWNSFQKHAESDPYSFVRYYSNPWLARVCEAWLGPGYQITAQVNIVHPGGQPQVAHRDYHLGFQTSQRIAEFPSSMQVASQHLTLQGAVAHSDMPTESGPTRLLPFSQLLPEGYMASRMPEFIEFFNENWVSLPMRTGDAVFFNPALFHAAGENQSNHIHRSANLLQISSAFGKPMEDVNTIKIIRKCWDELVAFAQDGSVESVNAGVAAMAQGYPFPTNLDNRTPAPGGMAPESEVDVLRRGLQERWNTEQAVAGVTNLQEEGRG